VIQPPQAPTASGTLIRTPFPHLMVYALERRLTGSFELWRGAASVATMVVVGGCPGKVRIQEPLFQLGNVMLELGMITQEALHASLARMQESPRLQGQALLELGAIDPASLEIGLRAQVERKVEHLFGLPSDTAFEYWDNVDRLQGFGGAPTPIDPFPVLWRGVRESPAWEHVDATLRRIGPALLRASAHAQLERFGFARQELEVVELLRQRPTRMLDVTSIAGPTIGQVLIYFLMILKQVELVDAAQVGNAPRTPTGSQTQQPSTSQPFARVQLQRQTSRLSAPRIVEEVVSQADDERVSSPGMHVGQLGSAFASAPPPADDFGLGNALDIGSMIVQTIASSMPPAAPSVPPMQSIPPAGSPPPPEPTSARPLTSEQNTLKAKILERADQITSQDYFQMLGLDRTATTEQIQKAFIGLAKVWHPDRLPPALVDVKDACSKVFTHITEAHATLSDPAKRKDYMTLLRDGGATPQDQAKIQAILEAATEFQKAEFLLKRNMGDAQAYELVRRCVMLDPDQADYQATLAWLDAQKPEWLSREKTLEKCFILDRCIQRNPNCERAYFFRGMLYKRADENSKALKDFKKAAELNPRNLDAMREVRLFNMRGLQSKPPAPPPKPQEAAAEKIGGLFGKLFKK
jgi:hypothetical protein